MYRENFYDVLGSMGAKIDVVVVPKNTGLKGYAWKALAEAGFDLGKANKVSDGQLELSGLTILLRRGEDVPQIVADERRMGRLAVGVTGDDLFDEYRLRDTSNQLKVINTYDWYDELAEFRRPTLCFMGTDVGNCRPDKIIVAIASKYEYTSRLYLAKSAITQGFRVEVQVYNGDLEYNVQRGYAKMCIDTVYSGKSRKEAGLEILQKIRFSDLSVIAPASNGVPLLESMAREIPPGPVIDRRKLFKQNARKKQK